MLTNHRPEGSCAGFRSTPEKLSRSRWYWRTIACNRANAALISPSVGAPLARPRVIVAGPVGLGSLTGVLATAFVWAAVASPATGSTACGCARPGSWKGGAAVERTAVLAPQPTSNSAQIALGTRGPIVRL